MYSVFTEATRQWNKSNDRHTKMQHLYVIAALTILVFAGLISLLNYGLGQTLVSIAAALIGIFIVNAIAWALADSFIFSNLSKRSTKR